MRVDLDGRLLDAGAARISPFDAGYLYGDGLFETLRSYSGQLFDLERHLSRMSRAAELLQIPFRADSALWQQRITRLLDVNALLDEDAVVRIQLSRGGGPEVDPIAGEPEGIRPVEFVTARPLPAAVAEWQRDGARVMTVQASFLRGNFPHFKSLNYLPSVMALRFARAEGYADAIHLSAQGHALEGASSNLFCVRDGQLLTPPTRSGILPGIARRRVLELAPALELASEERALTLRDLLLADEVFLSSSVKEIVPVIAVDSSRIGDGAPGPWTRQLQQSYGDSISTSRKS